MPQPELNRIYTGDAVSVLRTWPDSFVHCVVTSPPYWGLRNYGMPGQFGLEKTLEEYVAKIVRVFSEVKRVLRNDGTLWLNLGDCYTSGGRTDHGNKIGYKQSTNRGSSGRFDPVRRDNPRGLKPKDLVGIPWRVAFALQADGWYLRSDIIWSKRNPMPESVEDRPTRAHEYLFLLSKSPRYYFDMEAIREPASLATIQRLTQPTFESQQGGPKDSKDGNRSCRKALENLKRSSQAKLSEHRDKQRGHSRRHAGFNDRWDLMTKEEQCGFMRNKRSVWEIATEPFNEWIKIFRLVRVGLDDVVYGNWHIVSSNCQQHGGLFDSVSSESGDGYANDGCFCIGNICIHHAEELGCGCVPIAPNHGRCFSADNSDSCFPLCASFAIYRSKKIHKKAPFPSTSQPCIFCAQINSCIDSISMSHGTFDSVVHTCGNKISLGDKVDHPSGKIFFRTVSKSLNVRSCSCAYYSIKTEKSSHFATFPQKLVEPCILAGCPTGGIVLDPFLGSGTTALVALRLNRAFLGIELKPDYVKMAEARISQEMAQAKLF